jgi:streptomycin 6-kinase
MNTFKQKVINTWGKKGENWLIQLQSIIKSLAQHWKLDNIKPVNNMSYNYVALAMQATKTPVVLKISCDAQLILDEYKALKHFDGHGAIGVLDINKKHNALLLEQAIPGYLLKEYHPISIDDSIKIYAQVIQALSNQPLTANDFTHVNKWCEAIDRIKDQRINKRLVEKAIELKIFLLSSSEKEYLCHGDLHLENIVQQGEKWLAIDPKGIIGEMAFEAAAFDLVSNDEMQDMETLPEKIIARATQLSSVLNLNYDRLISWIFLRIIISAQWFIEDNGDPDKMLTLAYHLYPLLGKSYHKNDVCQTYEKISDWYEESRSYDLFEKPILDKVISLIKSGNSILDLGCGTGEPIAKYFLEKGCFVTGVDGSSAQIKKAKANFPKAKFIINDMRSLDLSERFDCIIAWHSFFHLPTADQRLMFRVFENHIKPHGILLFTSGPTEGEVWSNNGGEMLYHASLNPSEYRSLLIEHHFKVICHKVKEPSLREATVWMAKYIGVNQGNKSRSILPHQSC